ncbi:hypothetical protein TVAG_302410 [Trichomonas vaginalis G3]|uniref:Uncharacterized protein n=1 Tax=Trichomonas vaginalis (strain ATCC PRA-98 / G3) TaxID=412133 RepID=A2EGR6_TRIV3|nr:pfkB family carbohydrate kinase family [Trichomonas vaginalis G3]EAY08154.1 hypothetical protein TVAG_302410 [Trichomonas vaginalis G3]KAI5548714.1 pfkB family carbohydrate kinase family [Trichomonas vaginalis G3]|eukprot:XP_001320377.1 hypothetical protein [Trichomonas vaginalis G3]
MSDILFVGHCTKDVITINNETSYLPGGGVYFGAVSAGYCLKAHPSDKDIKLIVLTIGKKEDYVKVQHEMDACGAKLILIEDDKTTTFVHSFEDNNPDKRISSVTDIARSFTWDDVKNYKAKFCYVNPLFFGEVDPSLFKLLHQNCEYVSCDAQGLLRHQKDGKVYLKAPENIPAVLDGIDILKVDAGEATALTGIKDDTRKACLQLLSYGPRWVICTQSDYVELHTKESVISSKFGQWSLAGRTGRGDTVSAAFILEHFLAEVDAQKSLDIAATATGKKMMHPGAAVLADYQ